MLRVVFVIYIFVVLLMLLFPFKVKYPISSNKNNMEWLGDADGISFTSPGMVRAGIPHKSFYDLITEGDGISIELLLSSKTDNQKQMARIISYSINPLFRNFSLGQEGLDLIFRLRTENGDLNGRPQIFLKDAVKVNKLQHIVITYDYFEGSVYIDGDKLMSTSALKGRFSNWDPSYMLVLGNEVTGNRPWLGNIYRVAIYNRPLSLQEIRKNYETTGRSISIQGRKGDFVKDGLISLYLFNEGHGSAIMDRVNGEYPVNLSIPDEYEVVINNSKFLGTHFYGSPSETPFSQFKIKRDVLLNILLFLPFGYLFTMIMAEMSRGPFEALCLVVVTGILFSIVCESVQYFIEFRVSSLVDVINNSIGTILGINIARFRLYRVCS